ncbi:MAG TPA: NADH-quinone oxidoreductase subunit N [Actinomycetota bacterium]|nr:NADH-quinone oxidoreductase subunit N [Actinomycetota bacterium]
MEFSVPDVRLSGIAPEIVLSAAALTMLVVDAVFGRLLPKASLAVASTAALGLAGWFAVDAWDVNELQLEGMVASDGFSSFVKVALATFALLTVWLGRSHISGDDLDESEFYALVLFATAGMMLMAGAADLIMMFLALETFSIALYVLVAFRRRSLASQESSMKYFLLGAFSSAFFLLGIALVYGAVGSTNLYGTTGQPGIVEFLRTTPASDVTLLFLAAGLLIVGLGFKIAAVPFHMWTPDAYQGAPSTVTGFMAAASKLAGFAALIRLLDAALFNLRWEWQPVVIGIAVATMVVGSILAVVQEDVKRLLAYSSIAHAGFVLTAVVAANDEAVAGSLFYLATYGLTVLGAFAVVAVLAGGGESRTRLVDYKGLFYERPLLAAALSLFLLSLAGVPLTSGFVAKLVVFGPAVDSGYTWLVVVGMLASAVAAFFYLRVMVVMYMQERDPDAPRIEVPVLSGGVIALTALATVALGLVWGPLIEIAEEATVLFTTAGG